MNVFQLKCYYKTVKCGGVTFAAEKLFITQPAVSKQLKLLEEEIGGKLFFKRNGSVVLTSMGEKVYEKACEIIRLFDALENNLNLEGELTGKISVGCTPIGARFILPSIIKNFIQNWKGVNVSIFECESSEIGSLLKTDELDVALGFKPLKLDSKISFEKLFSSKLVAICSSDIPIIGAKTKIADISIHPFISYSPNSTINHLLIPYFSGKIINTVLNARSSETIIEFVQQGIGVSIVPELILSFLKPKNIQTVSLVEEIWIEYGVFFDKGKYLQEGQLKFIEQVRKDLQVQ